MEARQIDSRSLKQSLKGLFDRLSEADETVQRGIFRQLFKKIRVMEDNKVEVTWQVPNFASLLSSSVTEEKCSLERGSGGISKRSREHRFPPALVTKTINFLISPLYRNPAFLLEHYVEKGLSIAEISAQIFSSKEAVRKGLIQAGIEVREPHLPHHGRQSQPRFGQRRVKGHTTEFKREQHVVEAIREMRANGLTLRQIASTLTTMKISTKLNGKRWHPEMVSRILQGKREDKDAST